MFRRLRRWWRERCGSDGDASKLRDWSFPKYPLIFVARTMICSYARSSSLVWRYLKKETCDDISDRSIGHIPPLSILMSIVLFFYRQVHLYFLEGCRRFTANVHRGSMSIFPHSSVLKVLFPPQACPVVIASEWRNTGFNGTTMDGVSSCFAKTDVSSSRELIPLTRTKDLDAVRGSASPRAALTPPVIFACTLTTFRGPSKSQFCHVAEQSGPSIL